MEKTEAPALMKSLVIVTALAAVFSSFTLWLIESWIKYVFFIYGIIVIILIFLIVNDYNFRFQLRSSVIFNSNHVINALIIIIPSVLFLINIYQLKVEIPITFLALVSTSFIPGYAILRISKVDNYFSRLETLIFSYLLSYIYTGFYWGAFLYLEGDLRSSSLLLSYILLGVTATFRGNKIAGQPRPPSLCKQMDGLALLSTLGFYAISFMLMYPEFALLRGTDISRHYASSLVLARTPDLYIGSNYILAHLHESAFLCTSNASLIPAQMALLLLNFMLPLAFYIASKRFLSDVDDRIPVLASLFWGLFTNSFGGFSWIYFVQQKLLSPEYTQLQLLVDTAGKTYNGTVYGILGLWYFPATVAFVMLLVLVSMIPNHILPRKAFLTLFSIIFASMFLTHVTETTFFALFLALYGLISKSTDLRIDDSIVSAIFGFLLVTAVYMILQEMLVRFIINTSLMLAIFAPLAILCSTWVLRSLYVLKFGVSNERYSPTEDSTRRSLVVILVSALIFVYFVALFSWISSVDAFHTNQVNTIGLVPWFIYPIILGINGLLGIFALYFVLEMDDYKKAYAFFVFFLALAFVAGRVVSFVNLNFFQTGYWEKRFMWFIKIPLALLAPIPLIIALKTLKLKLNRDLVKTVGTTSLIGLIVIYGISTTFLNVEYWNYVTSNPSNLPSKAEMEAINSLKAIIDRDPRSWLATVTGTSASGATFAGPPDKLVLKQLLYTAKSAEMGFMQLYRHPAYSHPYIYIASRDAEVLSKQSDSFLSTYLETIPVVFNNSEVTIYNSSKVSFPQEKSDVALILPYDKFLMPKQFLTGYSMLSGNFADYTVGYDLDDTIFNSKILVLGYDPPQGNIITREYRSDFEQELLDWQVMSGRWIVGNGSLVAGDPSKTTDGIILTPLILDEFNASFNIKPIKFDPKTLNYASLIYSFKDDKHFKLAEIFFNSNGFIYVLTRSVEGTHWTQAVCDPIWPGKKTKFTLEPGVRYKVNVSVKNNSTRIFINGTETLSINETNPEGRIGLFYNRFNSVSFDEFDLNGFKHIISRPVEDYIQHLERDGTIIVLNTNGYRVFAERMFTIENNTIESTIMEWKGSQISLPTTIPVKTVYPIDDDTTIIANYSSPYGQKVPFIVEKNMDKGRLIYVNLRPLLEVLESKPLNTKVYSILNQLFTFVELPFMESDIIKLDGYVKEIDLQRVHITSNSILFPLKATIKRIEASSSGKIYDFENVTEVYIEGSSPVSLEAEYAFIEAGKGLYSTVMTNSTFSVLFSSVDGVNLRIRTATGIFNIGSLSKMRIIPDEGDIKLLVKNPSIKAERAVFHEIYAQGDLNWKTGVYGQDLKVKDGVSFNASISDTYTALKDVNIAGSWQLSPSLATFDELSTRDVATYWALILLPIFSFILIFMSPQLFRREERASTTIKKDIQ